MLSDHHQLPAVRMHVCGKLLSRLVIAQLKAP